MGLTRDEQSIKQPSDFLKLERENEIILKSNAYVMDTHWLKWAKKSVLCIGAKECVFCKNNDPIRKETYYLGSVNGEDGMVRLPITIIASMNGIEKMLKRKDETKDKRNYSWLVVKEGEGIETKYTTSKDEAVEVNSEEIEANNKKLETRGQSLEKSLKDRYSEYADKLTTEAEVKETEVEDSDIPF